ncbi:MAG: LptF/LptG family permease [Planctomycetia bacterium]|nr:LptF/LptG family permease [Planctomycetia bacterium]
MTLLDRYISYNFFKQMILWYVVLIGMFIVVDVFQNLDSYFSIQGSRSPWEVMGIHYFFISFSIIDMFLPFLIVMSALTLTAGMLGRNEFIALQSSGVSKFRAICPFLVSAILLSGASLWIREVFIPQHKSETVQTTSELANPENGISVKQATDKKTRVILNGEKIFADDNLIRNPVIEFPLKYFDGGVDKLHGETAIYCPENKEHPAGYLIQKVSKGKELLKKPSFTPHSVKHFALLTPVDHSWLKEDECFVVSGIDLEHLMIGDQWTSLASTSQLLREIRNPSSNFKTKDIEASIHTRILRPFADLIPLFIVLPFILIQNNQNVFRGVAIGGGLALVFIGVQFACLYCGSQYNIAVLAAWVPILLFTPVVVNVFWTLCH